MENFRLKVFRTVAEQLNFRKASELLHLSQPGVSQHVHALEEELGVALFDRTGNRVRLTRAGTVLLKYARRSASLAAEALDSIAKLESGSTAELRLGASTTPAQYILPRMLGAFNEKTPDWLSFFMFTYFTDRDGKMQLHSLAQSGFDPLSRTCRFMLTEEAHHMFVGETGITRVVQRTCDAMRAAGIDDPTDVNKVRALGVIDLPTIQKKLNLHYSLSLDLFGSEVSTNAANAFNAGVKGRYHETQIDDDHRLQNSTYPVLKLVDGEIKRVDEPALTALNMRLRDDYTQDCVKGMLRWNKVISTAGYDYKLTLPHTAFHRAIGEFKDVRATPEGVLIDDATWSKRRDDWLPSKADGDFIASLMQPVTEIGQYASWISPPKVGIDNKPGDFEYVKIET